MVLHYDVGKVVSSYHSDFLLGKGEGKRWGFLRKKEIIFSKKEESHPSFLSQLGKNPELLCIKS